MFLVYQFSHRTNSDSVKNSTMKKLMFVWKWTRNFHFYYHETFRFAHEKLTHICTELWKPANICIRKRWQKPKTHKLWVEKEKINSENTRKWWSDCMFTETLSNFFEQMNRDIRILFCKRNRQLRDENDKNNQKAISC